MLQTRPGSSPGSLLLGNQGGKKLQEAHRAGGKGGVPCRRPEGAGGPGAGPSPPSKRPQGGERGGRASRAPGNTVRLGWFRELGLYLILHPAWCRGERVLRLALLSRPRQAAVPDHKAASPTGIPGTEGLRPALWAWSRVVGHPARHPSSS